MLEIRGDFTWLKINNIDIVKGLVRYPEDDHHTVKLKSANGVDILELLNNTIQVDGVHVHEGKKVEGKFEVNGIYVLDPDIAGRESLKEAPEGITYHCISIHNDLVVLDRLALDGTVLRTFSVPMSAKRYKSINMTLEEFRVAKINNNLTKLLVTKAQMERDLTELTDSINELERLK